MSLRFLTSPSDLVRYLLIQLGLGSLPTNPPNSWPIYRGEEPSTPDNCITVYDTAGRDSGDSQVDGEKFEYVGIQVRIRSASYNVGYVKAEAIAKSMDEDIQNDNIAVGGRVYTLHSLMRSTQVLPIGTESPTSTRLLFTVNGLLSATRVS